ncbi:MAG TPA: heme-copper oxidase subunit III [Gemmatimonadales bacterium]|nr:heme-copper oxidase subunit III [Gemmatimonadales bacterium]
MTHAAATVDQMRPPYPAERGLDVYNNKLGMWIFLASEVMFFAGLIGSYVILRFGATGEWARPGIVLNIPITAFNTFLLICSSVSMVKAYASIQDGDQRGLRLWLGLTILGGATFVGIQIFEYIHLVEHGFTPAGIRDGSELAALVANGTLPSTTVGLYGSTFFTMTGFHGFHVTCGVISMLYLYLTKVLPGKYSKLDYRGIETVGLYWHFVDLVWIILFTIVYLI